MAVNASGTVRLFLTGRASTSGSLPLIIKPFPISPLNLYLEARGSSITEDLSLYTAGATSGTQYTYNTIPLYLAGEYFASYLNLYTNGLRERGYANTNLNLYIKALSYPISDSVDLVTWGSSNPSGGGYSVNNYTNLYIEGEGQFAGASQAQSYLNLYLYATPGVEDSLPLYLLGPSGVNNSVSLYVNGITGFKASGLNLYIHSTGNVSNSIYLYSRGYNP